jgi:hypothetical protein
MGEEAVEQRMVDAFRVEFADQRLERRLAHADIEAKDSLAIEIGDVVVILAASAASVANGWRWSSSQRGTGTQSSLPAGHSPFRQQIVRP